MAGFDLLFNFDINKFESQIPVMLKATKSML